MNPYDSGFIRGRQRYAPRSYRAGRAGLDGNDYSLINDAHSRARVQEVIQETPNSSKFNIQIEHDYA